MLELGYDGDYIANCENRYRFTFLHSKEAHLARSKTVDGVRADVEKFSGSKHVFFDKDKDWERPGGTKNYGAPRIPKVIGATRLMLDMYDMRLQHNKGDNTQQVWGSQYVEPGEVKMSAPTLRSLAEKLQIVFNNGHNTFKPYSMRFKLVSSAFGVVGHGTVFCKLGHVFGYSRHQGVCATSHWYASLGVHVQRIDKMWVLSYDTAYTKHLGTQQIRRPCFFLRKTELPNLYELRDAVAPADKRAAIIISEQIRDSIEHTFTRHITSWMCGAFPSIGRGGQIIINREIKKRAEIQAEKERRRALETTGLDVSSRTDGAF